jgi:hypothetical protein
MKRLLILPLFALALTAQAQTIPFDLEIGYRWIDLKGSSDMYRTQINERNGVLLRTFSMSGLTAGLDRYRINANDLGIGPAGSLRFDVERDGVYKLRFAYRTADAFSVFPSIANGQHVIDRRRRMIDSDLEFLPGANLSPFIGWSWNENQGPGSTTIHLGQDEFRLMQNVNEHDRELRFGTSFHYAWLNGQITQGWRNFRGTETLTLDPGAGGGNNSDPVLGQPITASTITRNDETHVKTPYTNFFASAQPNERLHVMAHYVRFVADADGREGEAATGSFASFAIGRFFTGFSSQGTSSARNLTWRGGGRIESTIYPNVDVDAGFEREHRNLDGSALIYDFFLQSITFGGADKRDLATILQASSSVDRDTNVFHAGVSARAIGPFGVRAEYRDSRQDVTVSPDLSEIVVPGNQGGDFNRRVHTFDLSGSFSRSGLMLGASYRKESANEPVFRTDFLDRDRWRLRAGWTSPKKFFRAGVTAERTNQNNDRPDIGYDAKFRQASGEVEVAPNDSLRFRVSASQFRGDSKISIRFPQNFTIGESTPSEDGNAREAGASYLRGPFSVDGSLAHYKNRGSIAFDIDRYRLRMTYDFKSKAGIGAEIDRDKYDDSSFSDYEATRYGLFLRWRP